MLVRIRPELGLAWPGGTLASKQRRFVVVLSLLWCRRVHVSSARPCVSVVIIVYCFAAGLRRLKLKRSTLLEHSGSGARAIKYVCPASELYGYRVRLGI